jgi:tRNA pseudouridine55 synthase
MDGLLVIDKPVGPTSHDVVARARRRLKERRIGHTGTLDPMASGVLPLVIGRATRLARFMTATEKRYEAVIRLGVTTDSRDALGQQEGPAFTGPWPDRAAIDAALDPFRGTFRQQPPAYSAKKIDGERSYKLARRHSATAADTVAEAVPLPEPAEVTAFRIELDACEGGRVALTIACSSGFYVRSLAHDLGQALGTGAHLEALRRTATSGVTLSDAVTLQRLEDEPVPPAALIPVDQLLPYLPGIVLTPAGAKKAAHGQDLAAGDAVSGFPQTDAPTPHFRLLDESGALKGIAEPGARPGLLHPAVILM